jgi:hypothetical protein
VVDWSRREDEYAWIGTGDFGGRREGGGAAFVFGAVEEFACVLAFGHGLNLYVLLMRFNIYTDDHKVLPGITLGDIGILPCLFPSSLLTI